MDVQTVRIDDWRQIWRAVPDYSGGGWLYRGQRSATWNLMTSVERSCERREVRPEHRREHEDALFREFRRSYHQYATHVPDPRAVVEWLSVMQHHGAPTRLLDFNYSIYIASYFALEKAEEDCAVWAVRGPWALQESAKLLRAAGKPNAERMRRRDRADAVSERAVHRRRVADQRVPVEPAAAHPAGRVLDPRRHLEA